MKIKKVILPKSGSSTVFQIEESESQLTPKDNEVVIEVHYSGINFADLHMRQGLYPAAPKFPFVPGYEVSGKVFAVGKNVDKGLVGKNVMAGTYFGGYASHIIVPMSQVFHVPEHLNLQEAAAIPVSFLTAFFVLFESTRVRSGDTILVDCASGSLGIMISQLLKGMPVRLVGLTSSESKKEHLANNGYDPLTLEEFEVSDQKFDIIINSRGGKSIKEQAKLLRPCGHMVCLGASSAIAEGKRNLVKVLKTIINMPRFSVIDLMNNNQSVGGVNLLNIFEDESLVSNKMKNVEHFEINPIVDKAFSYKNVSDAHNYIEQKKSKGKVLLSWLDE